MEELASALPAEWQKAFHASGWGFREVMGIDALRSPFQAITETSGVNEHYYNKNIHMALFNFVDVDRSGVNVNRLGDEEEAWSLADWEEAGVCIAQDHTPADISGFTVVGTGHSFRVVPTAAEATYRVRSTLTPETRRWLEKKEGASWISCASIAHEDLRSLTVADLRSLTWRVKGGGMLLHPDKCRIRREAQ